MHDSDNILTLFDDIILARSLNDSKTEHENLPIKHGEDIISRIVEDSHNIGYFESLVFIFEQIFDADKVLDTFQLSSFHLFAMYENMQALKYCLKLGVNINSRSSIGNMNFPGSTVLHIVVVNQKLDMVKYFVEQGVNKNCKDLNGNTPLHLAAAGGYMDIINYFHEVECDFLARNKRDFIPMHSSIMGDNLEAFSLIK